MRTLVAQRAVQALGWRYWPLVLTLMAIALSLPAVNTGLLTDDFVHRALLAGPSPFVERLSRHGLAVDGSGCLRPAMLDLFVAADPETNLDPLLAYGALPWWTSGRYHVAFWRPLPGLTHWLDYQVFPDSPRLMHFHNILWFAGVVLAVAVLYRRLIPIGWVAALAGLMFVLDDSSYFPTMWLANRNLLMSLFFGIVSLIAYDRWRRQRWRPGALGAPLCLCLSLLCGEAGIATLAYLLAYEVALGRGRWVHRGLALTPSVAVVVCWRAVYSLQGYGAGGGGFYFDPVRDPIGYATVVARRIPFLLGGQWTTVPADLHAYLPAAHRVWVWLAVMAAVVLIPLVMWPFLRVDRRARFWLIGMYGAALPFCATIPMSRSLLFVAVGAFGVIAQFLAGWFRKDGWIPSVTWKWGTVRNLVVAFLIVHVLVAAVVRLYAPKVTTILQKRVAGTTAIGLAKRSPDQDLIVVTAPNPMSFLYDPYAMAYEGRSLPGSVRVLAPGFGTVEFTRTAARRVVVTSPTDSLLDCQRGHRVDFVFFYRYLSDVRGPGHPLDVGRRFHLPGMDVEVLAVDDRGFPVEVAFEFAADLEDASLSWLHWDWDEDRYRVLDLPPVGGTVTLVGPF